MYHYVFWNPINYNILLILYIHSFSVQLLFYKVKILESTHTYSKS